MAGMNHITDPAMFERFHKALTGERPGYTPWYFLLSKGLKDPVPGISWKQREGRLTFEQALKKMRAGHNIGIAATGMDPLCIVDVDDIDATPDEIVKPTLSARSRKRIGRHYFYFTDDPRCKENLPTESKGEIRSSFEYVVAPGSFVLCNDETIAAMPESQRELAGRYTVENERMPDTIVFEELPPVFLEQASKNRKAGREAKKRREEKATERRGKKVERGAGKNKSAIWDLSMDDIWNIPNRNRFKSLFHDSSTGKNTSLNSDGGLSCWRHLVTHTPLSALCVLAGITTCNEAGKGMKGSAGGDSSIDYRDGGTVFEMWKWAKQEGIIQKDDPIPSSALQWYAVDRGTCKLGDVVDGWKLPTEAYNQAISLIEEEVGISSGRRKGRIKPGGNPTAEDFLDDDKKFVHNKFAEWLLNESGEHFITITDNNQVYRYLEGVYVPYGEAYIKHLVQVVMGGYLMTEHKRNEVVAHIRALTSINRDEFDKDLDTINMRNGLYHVESGEFEQHTPEYLSLTKMDVIFDPDATCPVIEQFVKDVVEPHRVDAIYEIAGYAVSPKKRLKRGFIFVGEPDTGKSTLIDLVCSFVGVTRICDVSPVVIGSDGHASYDFFGMLVNRVDDLGTTPIIETGVLKSIISSAPIRANQKYGKPFSFTPNVMILFGCNQVPMCADVRLQDKFDILKFKNVHSDRNINPDLPNELTTDGEMSGLFNKAMVAVKTAIKNRVFTGEYTLSDRQRDYEYRSNPLAQFVDELCELSDQEASVEKTVFRKIYIEWSKARLFSIATVGEQTTFLQNKGVMLRKLGPVDDRTWNYVGMDIKCDVQVVSKLSKSCPNEKPTVLQEQEHDSGKCVLCPTPILRGGSKKMIKVEGECDLDIGHQRKNDSGMPNSDLDIACTQVGHGQKCGKCGCKLSGQTFQGPAGLGVICAACQVELDQASGRNTITGEPLATMIKSAIFKIGYVRGRHEFTPAHVLMESPKDAGAELEMIKAYLIEHHGDLKIERIGDDVWRQVSV